MADSLRASEVSPIGRLIEALARKAVADYLTRKSAMEQENAGTRTKRGELSATREAA